MKTYYLEHNMNLCFAGLIIIGILSLLHINRIWCCENIEQVNVFKFSYRKYYFPALSAACFKLKYMDTTKLKTSRKTTNSFIYNFLSILLIILLSGDVQVNTGPQGPTHSSPQCD